jgi:hypothetical protein
MSKLHNAEEDWENYVSSRDRNYAQVVQISRFLDSIASHMPEMLRGVLQEVGEHQSEKVQAVGRKLDELLSKQK